jgi:hypothetical protein
MSESQNLKSDFAKWSLEELDAYPRIGQCPPRLLNKKARAESFSIFQGFEIEFTQAKILRECIDL